MWKERLIKINFLSLCLLACFPVLNMKVTVYAIIGFTFFSLVSGFFFNRVSTSAKRLRELAILMLPFLLIFIRTWIFDRSDEARFYLEVSLSLAAFPVAFFLSSSHHTNRQRNWVGILFVLSTVAIVVFGEVLVAMKLLEHLGPDKFWKTSAQMFSDPSLPFHVRTVFEQKVSIHPTHASLFLGISILVLTDLLLHNIKSISTGKKILVISAILFVLFLQVVLASRTPFIATMLGLLLLFFLHLKNKMHATYAAGILVVGSVILVMLVPTFSARFKEVSMSNTNLPTEDHENSFNLRTGIYKCSFDIIGSNWLWGVGPGNVQQELNTCYSSISKEVYDEKNYNTHNQFLDYWAGLGITGPISLLLIIGYSMYANLRRGQLLPVALALLFMISFFTENLLTRQNGVVPFAFFIGLYFYSHPQPKPR